MNRHPFITLEDLHQKRENDHNRRREKRGNGVDGIVADKANARDELCGCAAVLTLLCQRTAHAATEFRLQNRAKETIKEDADHGYGGGGNRFGGGNQTKGVRDKWNDGGKQNGRKRADEGNSAADSLLAFFESKDVIGDSRIATERGCGGVAESLCQGGNECQEKCAIAESKIQSGANYGNKTVCEHLGGVSVGALLFLAFGIFPLELIGEDAQNEKR